MGDCIRTQNMAVFFVLVERDKVGGDVGGRNIFGPTIGRHIVGTQSRKLARTSRKNVQMPNV